MNESLWMYTCQGVFRFASATLWRQFFDDVARRGWERPSSDAVGWLHSKLSPYPPWTFFTAQDGHSFADAVDAYLGSAVAGMDGPARDTLKKVAMIFREGPVLILSEPPRKTASTNLREVVYVYSCPQCGFLHHGKWAFDTSESSLETIRSTVESLLAYKYCPLCGSKEIVSVPFLLPAFDPDCPPDLICWQALSP